MLNNIITSIGGVGLFLIGMVLMTDGLKALAGERLQNLLKRLTGSRTRSIFASIGITTLMQSSHAATLTAISFVGAGLLTFEQALGVVYGANIGATTTAWIVSILGLKFKLGFFSFPLIGIGALMKLLGKQKVGNIGLVLAGFGLLFIGIDTLQTGTKSLIGLIDPSAYSATTLLNRFFLVLAGVLLTLIMQSSGASVAATLTILAAGAIDLNQAVALVIGQNISKTVTTAIAAIGNSAAAKRTAMAHILFNLITAILLFWIMNPVIDLLTISFGLFNEKDPVILLSAFHTFFSLFGVMIIAPATNSFASLIKKIIPDRGEYLTAGLDKSLLGMPTVALEAARHTIILITKIELEMLNQMIHLKQSPESFSQKICELDNAIHKIQEYLGKINSDPSPSNDFQKHVTLLHIIEHLHLIIEACGEYSEIKTIQRDPHFTKIAITLHEEINIILANLDMLKNNRKLKIIEDTAEQMTSLRIKQREKILRDTARGDIDTTTAYKQIEAIRWMDKITYRIWRAFYHLNEYLSKV